MFADIGGREIEMLGSSDEATGVHYLPKHLHAGQRVHGLLRFNRLQRLADAANGARRAA